MTLAELLEAPLGPVQDRTPEQIRRDLGVRILMLRRICEDVIKMRSAQRSYFANRSRVALSDSKRLEKSVDAQLAAIFKVPGLFDPVSVVDPVTGDCAVLGRVGCDLLDIKCDEEQATRSLDEGPNLFSDDGTGGTGN